MHIKDIKWGAAIGGAIAAEIAQIAAAFIWVAVYSYAIDPGQPSSVYQAHAQTSGPWVSIIAGSAIFYAASRWIARSVPTAMALFAVFFAIDILLIILAGISLSPADMALVGTSYLTKLLVCHLGGRHGAKPAQAV